MDTRARIERNVSEIRQRMQRAASRSGRTPECVRLVGVTKTVGIEEARILRDLCVLDLGENRIDGARSKVENIMGVTWHMIGSVQRRKARDIVALFDCVDSVDRVELAEVLDKRCEVAGKAVLPILVEVNVSGEESKHGIAPEALGTTLEAMEAFPRLRTDGLMTMAPFVDDPETVRPIFVRLRELAAKYGLRELSMGMSNDYEVAIEEGATQVRVGTALFT